MGFVVINISLGRCAHTAGVLRMTGLGKLRMHDLKLPSML